MIQHNLHSKQFFFGIFIFFVTGIASAQLYNAEVEAKIDLEEQFNFISVTATAFNKSPISQSLRYDLSVIKGDQNSTNKSKNSQNGRFVLNSGEQKSLSNTSINKDDTDRIIILLLVYDSQDNLIGKDRIVLNGNEKDKQDRIVLQQKNNKASLDIASSNDDGVTLRGVIVEDTKTKIGSDFYKSFSTRLRSLKLEPKEIITVKEDLAIGSNTKIEIYADQDLVVEFILQPRPDYLEAMNKNAVERLRYFLILKERNKTQVKRY